MQIFWLIDQQARVKLMQLQAELYKDKPTLDIARQKPPWELPNKTPEIPVATDMTDDQLGKFIKQPPNRLARVD